MRGRETFARYKGILNSVVQFLRLFPVSFRKRQLVFHRGTHGKVGMAIRYMLVKSLAQQCGDNVAIYEDVYFYNIENLSVGSNVSFHPMCYIECGKSPELGLTIEDDVSIAHGTTIMSNTHTYTELSIPIKDQPVVTKAIRIESDVWIGAKATILAGVTISRGGIVGANAVVTKNTQEYTVYAGVPAKPIKERK